MNFYTILLKRGGHRFRLLATFLSVFVFSLSGSRAQTNDFSSATLKIKSQTIRNLFSGKQGDKIEIEFEDAGKKPIQCSGEIISHLNSGVSSGVISVQLTSGSSKLRFLLNRKQVNGRLVYLLNLMDSRNTISYKLLSEEKDQFILQKTSRNKIVSE